MYPSAAGWTAVDNVDEHQMPALARTSKKPQTGGLLDQTSTSTQSNGAASIEVTLIESGDPLTKSYEVGPDGLPRKARDPFLVRGTACRLPLDPDTFADRFASVLGALDGAPDADVALVLGALSEDVAGDVADITTKDRHAPRTPGEGSPLIWRGKGWLGYRDGTPAVLGLDHDAKDLPHALRARLGEAGGLLAVLDDVCPAFRASARVVRPSVSTGICVADTGRTSVGGGLHVYVPVADGGDARDFVARLHDQLVLAGWGWAHVSEAGGVSVRSLIDTAASGIGERLWFEAPAKLGVGLAHMDGAREPRIQRGGLLDTKAALPPTTGAQGARLRQLQHELRAGVAEEAAQKRRSRAERVRADLARRGEDDASADAVVEQLLDADRRGVLNGRHVLRMDDGRVVSVADVLRDRASYHRATCADPLEPEYGGGRNKAVLYTDGRRARLFSHAHGGRLYALALDEADVIGAVCDARAGGRDPAKAVRTLSRDIRFAAGGWAQVEAATGMRVADALGFALAEPVVASVPPPAARDGAPTADATGGRPAPQGAPESDDPVDPDAAIDLVVRDFNARFAVVAEGGTANIVRLAYNADLGRHSPVSMTPDAFKLLYGNRYVLVAKQKRGGEVYHEKTAATSVWLAHPARRTCPDGFCLDASGHPPSTCFNLWQGFGVEEKPGDWSKLRGLIRDVLASGDEAYDHYIVQWLAHLAQRPDESPQVALVFRGEEGVGKGTLGRALMRLMRPHAMQITHAKHLTGAFNAHMRNVLFLFADEAFFAGDRANEGVIKGLVTEQFRVNEAKGRDATLGRNRIHLMMASNNSWVVPASADARRYAVFDVSSVHKQNHAYFGPILAEMDADGAAAGIAAMLYDLRRMRLDTDLVRKAPETAGLHAQRIASLQGPAAWLFDVLTRGYVSPGFEEPWCEHYTMEELYQSYTGWTQERRERYPATRHAVGQFLSGVYPAYRPRVHTPDGEKRPQGHRLGMLDNARGAFAEKHLVGAAWAEGDARGDGAKG